MLAKSALVTLMLSLGSFGPSLCRADSINGNVSGAVCGIYNNYVESQCVSQAKLKASVDREITKSYSVEMCKDDAFKTLLETDFNARQNCKSIHDGKLISELEYNLN